MKEYKDYNNHCIQWMGNIPSHWKSLGLKRTINLINEKTTDESLTYIGLENIESFTGRLSNTKFVTADSTCNLFKIGDILFNKLRPYLTKSIIADFEGKCTTELLVLRGFKGDTKYLNYILLSPEYIGYIDSSTYGSKMPRANWNFIGNVNIPFPPLSEQQHIVSFLDEKTAKIDEYIDKKNKEIEALKEWKKALIAHVVTKGLNTNAKMKDSGVSWIGEIPEHWKVKRLGAAFVENRTINSSLEITEAYKFNYGALIRKDEDVNPIEMMDTYCKYTCLNVNDIVINGLNLNYDFVSQRVAKAYAKGIITSAYLTLTPRDGINPNYYLYLLKSMDSMKLFHGMGTGIRLTLSYNEIKKQQILFPPLVEQQEIVEYIDAATTKADKMIVELTNHVESMKEYKQRLIADVVTGKINVQPCNTCL